MTDTLKDRLTPLAYKVTQHEGTEPAFSGQYHDCKEDGIYHCICCGAPLFDARHKFDSGTGWPSYYQPANDDAVATRTDRRFFMTRTEVHCSNCNAHLGHVFPDGPKPTGQRYCINSVSLDLKKK